MITLLQAKLFFQAKCYLICVLPELFNKKFLNILIFIQKYKKIKAIIFDLDGVLVDTKFIHLEALNLALKKHKLSIT